jgi:hypothetical protein
MLRAARALLLLLCCFFLLQACDLLLTWRLLTSGRPDVREANPVALALLERFGWLGPVLLKGGTSAVLVLALVLLGRRRPVLARRLLGGLCAVLGGVVIYSGWLLLRPDPQVLELNRLAQRYDELSRRLDSVARFDRKRGAICTDLLQGRIELVAAVERMRLCLLDEAPRLNPPLRASLPEADRDEDVAAFLFYHYSRLVGAGLAEAGQLDRLGRTMQRAYPAVPRLDYRRFSHRGPLSWKGAYQPAKSGAVIATDPS